MEQETKNTFLDIIEQQEKEIHDLKQKIQKLNDAKTINAGNGSSKPRDIYLHHLSDKSNPEYYELEHKDLYWQRDFYRSNFFYYLKIVFFMFVGIVGFCFFMTFITIKMTN